MTRYLGCGMMESLNLDCHSSIHRPPPSILNSSSSYLTSSSSNLKSPSSLLLPPFFDTKRPQTSANATCTACTFFQFWGRSYWPNNIEASWWTNDAPWLQCLILSWRFTVLKFFVWADLAQLKPLHLPPISKRELLPHPLLWLHGKQHNRKCS